tara:strand:+ start:94 stop:843 length:750 start_codon:yes stop_codon:yes gene_type:complete
MDERTSRIFFGLCLLVLVWIGVYWMWQPSKEQEPTIRFGHNPIAPEPERETPLDPVPDTDSDIVVPDIPATDPFTGLIPQGDPIANNLDNSAAKDRRLIPPEFTQHVVQQGELMQSIAKLYFGSIDEWGVIARANPSVDPRKLKPGMVLRIPKDKDNIQGKVIGGNTEPGVIEPHAASESKVIEYIVQSGDSLSRISQRIYGSSRHAQFIFESNRNILRSMDDISIGQLLKLPPLPDEKPDEKADENDS